MNVTNHTVQCFEKDGTVLLNETLADFFSLLNPLTRTADPQVVYDHFNNRFLMVVIDRTAVSEGAAANTSRVFLGVSETGDPLGAWFLTEFASVVPINSEAHWGDRPAIALDELNVYITVDMFDFDEDMDGKFDFGGVRIFSVFKGFGLGGFYDGGLATVNLVDPFQVDGAAIHSEPSLIFGATSPNSVERGVFLAAYGGLTNVNNQEFLQVAFFQPIGPFVDVQNVLLGDIETNPIPTNPVPDAPQPGTTTRLDTGGSSRRTLDAVWRDERLWVTTTIDPKVGEPDHGQATAHWMRVNTQNRAALTLEDQGSIDGEDIAIGTHTFYPSIAVNGFSEVTISFGASSGALFAGSYYAVHQPGDPAGTFQDAQVIRPGLDTYVRTFGQSRNRWGDYSAVVLDPEDECFWTYHMNAFTRDPMDPAPENGRWSTANAKVCPECAFLFELMNDTVSGELTGRAETITVGPAVTVTSSRDLRLIGGASSFSNGFSVVADGLLTVTTDNCPTPPSP